MTDLSNYDFALDSALIATHPIFPKSAAKLLVYNRAQDKITHTSFAHIFDFIPQDCLIVLNDTKVLPARIFGQKLSGGKIEFLYHKSLGKNRFLGQIKGKVRKGELIKFSQNIFLRVDEVREDGLRVVEFLQDSQNLGNFSRESRNISQENLPSESQNLPQNPRILDESEVLDFLQKEGKMPLPPYIKRESVASDIKDYQSVFAKNIGSIAAPTASLHFSDDDLAEISKRAHCFITLHIGAGTFFSVEAQDIRAHKMHSEQFFVSAESMQKIMSAKKILCVGTTATRCVEFLAQNLAQENPPCESQNLTQIDSQIPRLWMNFRGCAKRATQIEHRVHQGSELKHSAKSRHKLNLDRFCGECDIFINPLNPPIKTSHILTNFHLPKSTLIMLVAGFIGVEKTREIYQIAQDLKYRFYSYGDGMLIL